MNTHAPGHAVAGDQTVVLGLSGALGHDPSAALYIGPRLVAAAEEERFVRDKHARGRMPLESARFCLRFAGVEPRDVRVVAVPFAPIPLTRAARWHYAARHWYAPDRALDALFNGNRRYRRYRERILALLRELGIDPARVEFHPVEHHLAHASSAYHLSGFDGRVAIMGVDGKGEYTTTFFGYGENGRIHRVREFHDPDSLGGFYGALTEYLGFEMLDGEYKVMGMAPYGDPRRYDLSRLLDFRAGRLRVNTRYVNTVGLRRYRDRGRGCYYGPPLVDWLGPPRHGDSADEPYVHYAAAVQQLFEDAVLALMDHYLGDIIRESGRIVFAGGGALNVKLNQRIIARPEVRELFVQPASGDAGTAVGAASFALAARGVRPEPMEHVYLGPAYDTDACRRACAHWGERLHAEQVADIELRVARLLADGHPVAWFQGRMEFGPRALGARSILGCPSVPGIAERINAQIKYRERWRPFCPSMLDRVAPQMLGSEHPAPFMTITFPVCEEWKSRVPEVVHQDGTARAQVVERRHHPRYYALLEELERLTGNGVVLNTSLNRRGEAMVCSPGDALAMFFGSDLQYLALEDLLVTKS
ncbi:MAG: nebramycin 5' synthase [Pseudomonadales bacterium]|nr:nebramycin 5' synthase [Pseudomonadales bacterium]